MNPTSWQFYLTSKEAWEKMIDALAEATTSIDFEQFYFIPDEIGKKFINILIAKAKEGVQVRCIFDAAGTFPFVRSLYSELMQHAGIEVRFFNWLLPFTQGNKSIWYFRDHRRSLIIDSKIGFTGSICIGRPVEEWDETQLRIEGPVVLQMADAFEKSWDHAHKQTIHAAIERGFDADGFSYVTQAPLPKQRFLYYTLIRAIRTAQTSISIVTPYFLPDHRLLRSLIDARSRGVRVRLLIPRNTDHPFVDIGSHTYFTTLLRHGIELYKYNTMLHAKTVVIDGTWAMVGSMNMDSVSLRYNFEAGIVSTNAKFAREVEQQYMNRLERAIQINLEDWNKRSYFQQALELIVWPFRKLL